MDQFFQISYNYNTFLLFIVITAIIHISQFFLIVEERKKVIIERLGKFHKICSSGLNFKVPFLDSVKGSLNLKIMQLDVSVETKTSDNVFLNIVSSVQYKVIENKAREAFYTLENPEKQMQSYIFDAIRAKIPLLQLDDVFSKKDDVADFVQTELSKVMESFGFEIIRALITDIHPDSRVKRAMNEINEAQRLRAAAIEKAEAEKVAVVTAAQAQAESKILQGQGIAGQRKAIIDGLKDSLDELRKQTGSDHKDAMTLLLVNQYFDTLKDIGAHSKTSTMFLNHNPSGMNSIMDQIRNTILESNVNNEKNS